MSKSCLGFVIGVLSLSACAAAPDPSLALAQPADEAIARLEGDDRTVEGTGMGSLTIAHGSTDEDMVTIEIRRAGDRRAVPCRVKVHAVSEQSSRADVDCRQTTAGKGAAQDVAVQAVTLVMREHVVAAVADRPYDIAGVADGMMMLVATNGPKLAACIAKDSPPGDTAR